MCVGVEFITFNVLLHTKSEQKVIGNWFCTLIILKNSLKPGFQEELALEAYLNCNKKNRLINGLIKVIGIQETII